MPTAAEKQRAEELTQQLALALAGRPRRRQNLRRLTDKERAEIAARHRRRWARDKQALLDLAAALEGREQAERAVTVALAAAMEGNAEKPVRELMGVSPATFWRRVKAARESVDE